MPFLKFTCSSVFLQHRNSGLGFLALKEGGQSLRAELIGAFSDQAVNIPSGGIDRIVARKIHVRQDDQADPVPPMELHVGAGAVDSP